MPHARMKAAVFAGFHRANARERDAALRNRARTAETNPNASEKWRENYFMEHLTLKTDLSAGATSVSNLFLDHYMPKASGEYTKVYLYLLRFLQGGRQDLTVAGLADALEYPARFKILGKTTSFKIGVRRIQYPAGHLHPAGTGTGVEDRIVSGLFRRQSLSQKIIQPHRTGTIRGPGGDPAAAVRLRTIHEKNIVSLRDGDDSLFL